MIRNSSQISKGQLLLPCRDNFLRAWAASLSPVVPKTRKQPRKGASEVMVSLLKAREGMVRKKKHCCGSELDSNWTMLPFYCILLRVTFIVKGQLPFPGVYNLPVLINIRLKPGREVGSAQMLMLFQKSVISVVLFKIYRTWNI